jgi:RNA polymerase sigma-70 factor (ECF subfamily)
MQMKDFTHTVNTLKDSLYRFSLRIVGRTDEAEDVVQEVFIKCWERRKDFDAVRNMDAMMMKMVKNLSIDKLRSKHHRLEDINHVADHDSQNPSPASQTEVKDAVDRVGLLIQELPLKQQMVFQLREIEEKTYKEIEAILEIPESQVKVNLFRARNYIKTGLIKADAYGL